MSEDGWMPISTAPKDGSRFLAYWPGGGEWRVDAPGVQLTAWWKLGAGEFYLLGWSGGIQGPQPSYWQPLPPPPHDNTEVKE